MYLCHLGSLSPSYLNYKKPNDCKRTTALCTTRKEKCCRLEWWDINCMADSDFRHLKRVNKCVTQNWWNMVLRYWTEEWLSPPRLVGPGTWMFSVIAVYSLDHFPHPVSPPRTSAVSQPFLCLQHPAPCLSPIDAPKVFVLVTDWLSALIKGWILEECGSETSWGEVGSGGRHPLQQEGLSYHWTFFFFNILSFIYFVLLARLQSMWDLSSQTRNWTLASCNGNLES